MSTNFIKLNKSFLDFNKYNNFTYIEVLLSLNIKVPHICYHNQLPVSGNCRLCLGIIGADKKPAPLCATSVSPNDVVDYNSPRVRRLRQDVLEFLLINHPMDCPSCDQGGECDLQDYSYNYGSDRSRHAITFKKTILNKDRGAIVKTVMNRCLNCTRCTRFFAEVVGNPLVGIIGRGINSEISSYVDSKFDNCEFSGNVIDLCPVGALTSQSNAFAYRPWNLTRYNSFDALDSLGSCITLHYYGAEIVKVTPRINYNLNLNWISDKVRYIFDGLYKQRLLKPLYREINGELISVSWNEIFFNLKRDLVSNNKIKNLKFGLYFGELLNNETIFTASKFMDIIGNSNKYSIQDSLFINNDFDSNYLFNSRVTSLSNTDFCAIIGSNLKSELPLLNVRLRKQYLANALPVLNFGAKNNLMYPAYYFGFNLKTLIKFFEGNNSICKLLFNKKNPLFLLSIDLFKNETLYNVFNTFKQILKSNIKNITNNNFNYIYPNIDLYNKLYLNIQSKYKDNINSLDCLYLLNVDNNFDRLTQNNLNKMPYVIYQGHHYNKYINFAKVILPSKTYLQEIGSFINLEGDICKIKDIVYDDNIYVKENIIILYSVFSILFNKVKDNLKKVIKDNNISELNPVLKIQENYSISDNLALFNNIKIKNNIVKNYTINSTLYNFYANDNISNASQIMSNCNKSLVKRSNY